MSFERDSSSSDVLSVAASEYNEEVVVGVLRIVVVAVFPTENAATTAVDDDRASRIRDFFTWIMMITV